MKLQTAVTQYVSYQMARGVKSSKNEQRLKAFVRAMGQDKNISDIQAKEVDIYLAGNCPLPFFLR
jgi:hypothetical protein